MKAISLWQPHASLMSTGAKEIETRHWKFPARCIGRDVAIHAALHRPIHELLGYLAEWRMQDGLAPLVGRQITRTATNWAGVKLEHLPFGAIVAVVTFVECRPTGSFTVQEIECEQFYGNFTPGRFGWVTTNPRRLKSPVPYKGHQGFFNLPEQVEAEVRKQLR